LHYIGIIFSGLGYVMYLKQKAGKQNEKYQAEGQVLEQKFAKISDTGSNDNNWINGTYVKILIH
jgi:hypothetical protein